MRLARVIVALVMGGFFGTALAGEVSTLGPLEIDTPWVRASIDMARPGAAYVIIRNTGDERDRLVGVATPVAARPEVHEMEEVGGVMKMRPAQLLEIPRGGEIRLALGSPHIMLMQLQTSLEEGKEIPLTFVFEKAGEITPRAPVASIAASGPPE